MPYDIIFIGKGPRPAPSADDVGRTAPERDVGDDIFISNLPTSSKVFAFVYRGSAGMTNVEDGLRSLGQKTGSNFFVNFSSLADPDYKRARERFGIKPLPAIVVTAVSPLAQTPDGGSSYVRLDSKSLFAKPEQLIETVEKLFNLYLGGNIYQAAALGWKSETGAVLTNAAEQIWHVIQPVIRWVARTEICLEFADFKLELKERGGHQ